ncbi:MAG TPA: hypothetical protein VFA38_03455 [Nitrospirales bacterium]|nr:hypothetical protein [Nitrospirales bacterium]
MDDDRPASERLDDQTYTNLLTLWTSGVRDYHTLLSDYLTANSIFVAAISLLLSRERSTVIFQVLVVILCLFGILMTLQMAIVLGRFSSQTRLWEWQLRGIERTSDRMSRKPFQTLHQLTKEHRAIDDPANDPPTFYPNWATRQHRQWWARREISFPLFFGIIYLLFLVWGSKELLRL